MGRRTAIGVDDDLAAGEARIAVRPADHEDAGGVHIEFLFRREPALGQNFLDHAAHKFAQVGLLHAGLVLGRDDDGRDADRLAVFIFQRDLALRIGLELGPFAGMAKLGHALQDTVRIDDWGGHEHVGFSAGIAEHDALVAGAFILVAARIDALRNVGRLGVEQHFAARILPVETVLLIADRLDGIARRFLDQVLGDRFRAADFAGENDRVRRRQRFAGNAGERFARKEKIDDGIGNPVAHLVGMALGNGFAGEQVI